jgi:DGQHR domain-containing protein
MSTTTWSEEATTVMSRTPPAPRFVGAVSPSMAISIVPGPKLRSGVPLVTGFIPAGALLPENYVIPYHNPNTLRGYQRPPQEARINELVNDLRKGQTDLPTAVLLNLRNREARHFLQGNVLNLSHVQDTSEMISAAVREAMVKFYVVDGQHRILALLKLLKDFPNEDWDHFLIPFVCMLGATEEEEMAQFYIVNSKAKSVRTDLALELLKKLTERNPEMMDALTEKGKAWQVQAQQLARELSETSPVWRGRIRFAAMEKGETTLPSASMVTSLQPVLASPYFKALEVADQLKVLDAFWRGMRNLVQEAFDNPADYVLQKGVGVIALHTALVQVVEIVRARGGSVIEPESYEKVLREPLEKLQGDDRNATPVSGIDFWRAGPEGAAGSYSSSAGRRVLAAKIQALLPRIAVL